MAAKTLQIFDAHHIQNTDITATSHVANVAIQNPMHKPFVYFPYLTDNGGSHRNTIPTSYNGEVYLKCRHLHNN